MTADAHALLFAEGLCQLPRQDWKTIDDSLKLVHGRATFVLTRTDFVVVVDEKHPEQYGRTIRIADLPMTGVKNQAVSSRLTVLEASLSGNEQEVLAAFLDSMGLSVDEPRWKEINQQLSGSPSPPTKAPAGD